MKILLQQTLHGYQNGHQLLNASTDLLPEEKKMLLYQSDLSGSNFDDGFRTYITGYPLSGGRYYTLARTWYANEMKRPGCVWTHSLLINLSDLGKIPELAYLNDLFRRPEQDDYKLYSLALELDILRANKPFIETSKIKNLVSVGLYEFPKSTVFLPSAKAGTHEEIMLNIWGDQWPRMRRNFAFCGGALGIKVFEDREFDLQVVPENRTTSLVRQSTNPIVADTHLQSKFDWGLLQNFPKNKLRKFLWTYGADIIGERENYIPLLELYKELYFDKPVLNKIASQIRKSFPNKKQAKSLKTKLFNDESLLYPFISEKELLTFLITTEKIDYLLLEELNIEKRLEKLLNENEVSVIEFLNLWKNAHPGRLTHEIWDVVDITNEEIINLFKTDENLIDILIEKMPEVSEKETVWKLDSELQQQIFKALHNSNLIIDWEKVITAILNAESSIILEMVKEFGQQIVVYSLNWLNNPENHLCLISAWSSCIVKDYYEIFYRWVHQNKKKLHPKVFAMIFIYCPPNRVSEYRLSGEIWVNAYNELKENNYCVNLTYLSCMLLGLAFEKRLSGNELIASETFLDVYNYAASSKVDFSTWALIPKEQLEDEEEEVNLFEGIFTLLGFGRPKKRHEVESWDYCEQLIRSFVNKQIKLEWSSHTFLNSLKDDSSFKRAIEYCFTIKKGERLVKRIVSDINNKRVFAKKFQTNILNSYIRSKNK